MAALRNFLKRTKLEGIINMYTKEELRKVIRGYRRSLSQEESAIKSIAILNKLFETEQYKNAECIYCYIDFRNEVKTDALMIMPGIAFDRGNHRIGFGGGYYDKYLERENTHFKIALAYHFQIFSQIPFESHDICPDMILTDL